MICNWKGHQFCSMGRARPPVDYEKIGEAGDVGAAHLAEGWEPTSIRGSTLLIASCNVPRL